MSVPRELGDIDWDRWRPEDRATLLFVIDGDEVLLIHKKRGFGKGKVNGPGGKLHDGETPLACALRECREEVGLVVSDAECMGQHRFQFTDGYSIQCWVFRSFSYRGEPVETDEAAPFWAAVDDLPFDDMWEDDRHWLPMVLSGQHFDGRWIFDGERMLDHQLEPIDPPVAQRAAVGSD